MYRTFQNLSGYTNTGITDVNCLPLLVSCTYYNCIITIKNIPTLPTNSFTLKNTTNIFEVCYKDLTKEKSKILASRLQQCNLLASRVKVIEYRQRSQHLARFYSTEGELYYQDCFLL